MNQAARVLSVYGSFLRGAGQHFTFYECVADLVENGGSIEDVAELVREAKKGERDRISYQKAVMADV